MTTIGFVILTWNSSHVIADCIQSIANLTAIKPTVLVVDNGSIDDTVTIIKDYVRRYPQIFSLIQYGSNQGTTVPRNIGIKRLLQLRLDFYCILDSDTVVNDDALVQMIHELKTHEHYGLIGPKMITSSNTVQISARCFPTFLEKILKAMPIKYFQLKGEDMEKQQRNHESSHENSYEDVYKEGSYTAEVSYTVDYLMSACWLIKPQVFDIVGFLDEKIFYAPEDAEYCIRVWKSGYQVAFCPSACIIHEWQRLSKKKLISKINWEHIKGLAYMFKKHKYLFTKMNLVKSFARL